jgi:prepilin-type processing-associated H-X9-DG protein
MHNGQGNIVMGDGSVQQMSSSRLRSEFPRQDSATNYLVIP